MAGSLAELLDRGALRWPLLAPAAGFWLGAAIGPAPSRWLTLPLVAAALLAALRFRPPGASLAPLALVGFLAGAQAASGAGEAIACPSPAGSPRQALGAVLEREPSRDGRTELVLQLSAVQDDDLPSGFRPLHCRALLSTGSRAPTAAEGDQVWLPAADWEEPRHLYNPGSGDSASQLTDRGIGWVASLKDGASVVVLERSSGLLGRAGRLRRRFQAEVERRLAPSAACEVLLAVALGQRATLSPETRDRFQDAGSGHLLSAGVLYLALLTACLGAGLAWLWRRSERLTLWMPAGRASAVLSLPLPLAFALASGSHTAGERAAILIAGLLLARALGRGRPDRVHLCALASLGLIALRPEAARDTGLLLAAAAVAGIVAIGSPLVRALAGPPEQSLGRRLPRAVAIAFALSLAAWLTTWPEPTTGSPGPPQ